MINSDGLSVKLRLAILALDAKCFPGDQPFDLSRHEVFPIIREGKVLAYGCARICDGGTSVFLSRVGVDPRFAGNGLQKRLIRIREKWAAKRGVKYSITYVHRHNGASIASLIKSGYLIYQPAYEWASSQMVYFIKELKHGENSSGPVRSGKKRIKKATQKK